MADSADLAQRFRDAMLSGDADTLRSIVTDDVTFTGPVAKASGSDEVVNGLVEMGKMTTSDDVQVQLADASNVLVWSTLQTNVAPPTEAATWLSVNGDKISAVRTVFNAGGAK